ncbi:hypothetical protein SCHPADRAFT_831748 [Schizopora paradoxa]|uniref:BTB domain-containing protein n=1 Tax=Schizopora paradoxa TaxID=27342 RepID=A0A0H2RHD8_9AGAM|nr:hypothetical protein SCHPADRAFT_831748 [Schizopora paradoxa]
MDVVTVDAQPEDQAIDISEPHHHETLWYEDGNVVLKTDEHLYRVHKSVLSRHSTVFKDMFDVAEDGEGETKDAAESKSVMYEGLPLVALDDGDEDVFNFLSTLYSRSFFRMHQRTTLSILVSLSRMSTRYNASEIRTELIAHLAQIYPDTLAKYEAQRWNTLFERPPHDLEFHLLALARRCDAHILLPSLFYTCASLPLYLILDSSAIVSQEDHRTILEAVLPVNKTEYNERNADGRLSCMSEWPMMNVNFLTVFR